MSLPEPRRLFPNEQVAADRLAQSLEPFLAEVLAEEGKAAGLAPRLARYVVASDWFEEQIENGRLHGRVIQTHETLCAAMDRDVDATFTDLLTQRDRDARHAWDEHRRAIGGQ